MISMVNNVRVNKTFLCFFFEEKKRKKESIFFKNIISLVSDFISKPDSGCRNGTY